MGQKQQLQELLDVGTLAPAHFMKIDIDSQMMLEVGSSGVPLLNMTDFLLANQPDFTNEINFWFKYTLKCYEKLEPSNIDRALILLAHLLSSLN